MQGFILRWWGVSQLTVVMIIQTWLYILNTTETLWRSEFNSMWTVSQQSCLNTNVRSAEDAHHKVKTRCVSMSSQSYTLKSLFSTPSLSWEVWNWLKVQYLFHYVRLQLASKDPAP